jgi:SUMO ligase MMS21 Smc5/6 complex component
MSKQFKDKIKHLSISLEKGQNNTEILDLFTTEFRQLKMNISGKLLIKFPTH